MSRNLLHLASCFGLLAPFGLALVKAAGGRNRKGITMSDEQFFKLWEPPQFGHLCQKGQSRFSCLAQYPWLFNVKQVPFGRSDSLKRLPDGGALEWEGLPWLKLCSI